MNNALICHPISPSPTFSDSSPIGGPLQWGHSIFLFFEDFFAINGDLDHPRQYLLLGNFDEAMPYVSIEGTGLHRTVKLHRWTGIMQNFLGIRFQESFEVPVDVLQRAGQISIRGKIEDGPGKRLLFEALGRRTVTCMAHWPSEAFSADLLIGEPVSFNFIPDTLSVDFFAESPEDLQNLLSKLNSVRGEVAKRQGLSMLKGDYAPFRAWAGIDPETGKVKTAQANNFNELFD